MPSFPTAVRRALPRVLTAACLVTAWAHAAPFTVGEPAPPLEAATAEGTPVDLAALHGHVVLLNLWASWCPPCRAELPLLADVQERHRADGVVVVALSADRHRDRADALRSVRGLSLTTVFMDGARRNGYAHPDTLPWSLLIDEAGRIAAVFPPGRGALDASAVEAALAPLLNATHAGN